ncbi:MAG: McrB family protein [Bacteroidota bacterium]
MNNKEQFKTWVFNNLTEKSGAASSYISSLEWLSDRFYEKNRISKKSIFEIEDIDLISQLHLEVKKIQRDKNSFIYNKNASSYGERYFYSASLSKYKEFLQFKNSDLIIEKSNKKINNDEARFDINTLFEDVFEAGLVFSETLIIRFVASLCTKPFVICSGLSGSGKTKLAQAFVQWICESDQQYKIIPVGADWTNREPLLGYPNGLDPKSYVTPDSGALQLITEASKEENENKPYFMILDEMNLSHVERYFADFLSIMESGDSIKLYSGANRVDSDGNEIEKEIIWPKNLFIIGTVNIDETTYMFSPKVLDRANVIEFRITPDQMDKFFKERKELNMKELFLDKDKSKGGAGQNMGESFFQLADDRTITKIPEIQGDDNVLNKFFSELQFVGSEFGYRSATEIELLITKLGFDGLTIKGGESMSNNTKIDIAIMQKLLPKLHGSRKKLVSPLETLAGLCLNHENVHPELKPQELYKKYVADNTKTSEHAISIKYPISFEKIERMLKNAIDNGFTSYAEA